MNIEPTGPYVYQPYAVATKHGAAGRLWAVSGLSSLHPLASGELRGLTREEAQRVVDALTASPVAPKAGAGETDAELVDWLEAHAMAVIVDRTVAPWSPPNIPATRASIAAASRAVPTAPAATETNDG